MITIYAHICKELLTNHFLIFEIVINGHEHGTALAQKMANLRSVPEDKNDSKYLSTCTKHNRSELVNAI